MWRSYGAVLKYLLNDCQRSASTARAPCHWWGQSASLINSIRWGHDMNSKLLAGASVALFAVPILFTPSFVTAHHTWVVQYDRDDIVILEGTVSEIRLISPHSRIFIKVDGTDGPGIWAGETWPLGALYRRGLTHDNLAVGDVVRVTGERAVEGRLGLHLRSIYRPADQWRLWIGLGPDTGENSAEGIGDGIRQFQLENESV